ncbi:hypothetical protein D9M68_838750 [compost metagenome]
MNTELPAAEPCSEPAIPFTLSVLPVDAGTLISSIFVLSQDAKHRTSAVNHNAYFIAHYFNLLLKFTFSARKQERP